MNTTLSTLFLIALCNTNLGNVNRYPTLPDFDDTTSWANSMIIAPDVETEAVLMHYFDVDYYRCSSSLLRSSVVRVNCLEDEAEAIISIYKNSTSNFITSYSSELPLNYSNFQHKLVSLGPNDTLYIKIEATNICSPYSLMLDTSPNINQVKIIKHNDGNEPTSYYGTNNLNTIRYYCDISCDDSLTTGSNYTFRDAYVAAIGEWNKVGNLVLEEVYSSSLADVILYVKPSSYFDIGINGIANTTITKIEHYFLGFLIDTTYEFDCSSIEINKSCPSGSNDYNRFLKTVKVCIHEIGHSLGLDHSLNQWNYMYSSITSLSPIPFNEIGDGDVMSYLYLYGNL